SLGRSRASLPRAAHDRRSHGNGPVGSRTANSISRPRRTAAPVGANCPDRCDVALGRSGSSVARRTSLGNAGGGCGMSAPRMRPEELIFAHQGLVRAIARGIHRSFPRYIDLDDLIGYGQLGLAQAAQEFDPERGIQFSTFAYYRIRGAILDGANQLNWLKRTTRAGDAYDRMSGDVLATDVADSAGGAGHTDEAKWLSDVGGKLGMVFLLSQAGEDADQRMEVADDEAIVPLESLLDDELKQTLRTLIDELPADARQLVRATYFEGKTLKDAGEQLGISKAWASRLHARSLDQLARGLRRAHVAE